MLVLLLGVFLLALGPVLVDAALGERQQLAGVIGELPARRFGVFERDPGLEPGADGGDQVGPLELEPVLGAELEVVRAGAVGDQLDDLDARSGDVLDPVGDDPGRRHDARAVPALVRAAAARDRGAHACARDENHSQLHRQE